MKNKFFLLFLIGLIYVFLSTTIFGDKKLAPDIIAKDIYGNDFQLYKYKEKPKILQFMKVYCGGSIAPNTVKQLKQLTKLYKIYKDKIIFVTITLASCPTSDLKIIADELGIKWTFINDFSDYKLDIIKAYAEYLKKLSDPALIFINKKNQVLFTSNYCSEEELLKYINSILETIEK
ncbi:MAG: redoxin domain-containing protein [Candidatus Omnitrophica bacterium]|nr:redoxin domain-containing protein [Candidatus Omnitrophota bacterium]